MECKHTRVHSRYDTIQLLVIPYLGISRICGDDDEDDDEAWNFEIGHYVNKSYEMMIVVVNINLSLLVESDSVLIMYAGVWRMRKENFMT